MTRRSSSRRPQLGAGGRPDPVAGVHRDQPGRAVEPSPTPSTSGRQQVAAGDACRQQVAAGDAPPPPPPSAAAVESTTALVAAVWKELHGDGSGRESLERAIEAFSAAVGGPGAAVDRVNGIRRAVLRGGLAPRARVDEVVDRVMRSVVERLFADLQTQALTDPLTGLGNRRALTRDLEIETARVLRTGTPLTVVVVDVDGLKQLNDTEGHDAGDDALRRLGRALRTISRSTDRAYRHGGDEFALLLPDAAAIDPDSLLERLLQSGAPSCTIGMANSSDDPIHQLMILADRRLCAKRWADRSPRRDDLAARRHHDRPAPRRIGSEPDGVPGGA